ncbi:hypothetical protein TrLO_g1587 [Triparma laevis f. longispina]|uniref:Uncharacterized protein n=1 Tax=Triparma laevis f. longispina TaxID=1714387 RepID=A0A9W7C5M5_9STRA|nr:hypothetical protein TrLO_g1587 [Triparma laevis f. longispina]
MNKCTSSAAGHNNPDGIDNFVVKKERLGNGYDREKNDPTSSVAASFSNLTSDQVQDIKVENKLDPDGENIETQQPSTGSDFADRLAAIEKGHTSMNDKLDLLLTQRVDEVAERE